jgi:ribosomal protein L11 methyltransferase
MDWVEICVHYKGSAVLAEELIGFVMNNNDITGVVVEIKISQDQLVNEFGGNEIEEGYVRGYVVQKTKTIQLYNQFEDELAKVLRRAGIEYKTTMHTVNHDDWANKWREFFKPEKVSSSIVIKPTWRSYVPARNEHVIEIDPGMAFGTGIHPTTRSCIQLIEKYIRLGSSVLDIGTGSGVLVIAARKLGAKFCLGLDNDIDAVRVAQKNCKLNQMIESSYGLCAGNMGDSIQRRFDIVVANLQRKAILILIDQLKSLLDSKGVFILSGILSIEKKIIETTLLQLGYNIKETIIDGEWTTIAGQIRQ